MNTFQTLPASPHNQGNHAPLFGRGGGDEASFLRVVSFIFNPQYFPLIGFLTLFYFTHLIILPLPFKCSILAIVLIGTLLIPSLIITVGGLHNHTSIHFVHIIFCVVTWLLLATLHLPPYMKGIIASAIIIQLICILATPRWNLPIHSITAGGAIGALCAFSLILMFSPLTELCLFIIIAGLIGSSTMILHQHDLWQVMIATTLGCIATFLTILLS